MGSKTANLPIVKKLLASRHPSVQFKVRTRVLGENPASRAIRELQAQIKVSTLATGLLSHRKPDGTQNVKNAYAKWQGPHWTLVNLAEIGYPAGDQDLLPMRDQFYAWLFAPNHMQMPHTLIIKGEEDRVRRCASQEGNAVWYSYKLGLTDSRTDELVSRLQGWQWPDGGWNCDKRPGVTISSFFESLIPLRALAFHAELTGDRTSRAKARHAAEIFLKRHLFKRESNQTIINPNFTKTCYPYYADYNILFALVVMAEAGFIRDARCQEALDLLESKRLAGGGFPAERKLYKKANGVTSRGEFVDWGPSGKTKVNEFATADALYVLKAAGRL